MGEKIIIRYIHNSNTKVKRMAKGEAYAKTFNEAEIHRRAIADPDARPLTKEQLVKFKPINHFSKKR